MLGPIALPGKSSQTDIAPRVMPGLSTFSSSGSPPPMVNMSGRSPSLSVRAASRTSTARRHSGTRCSRFAFIRAAGMVHTWAVVSISAHRAQVSLAGRCRWRQYVVECENVQVVQPGERVRQEVVVPGRHL